MISRTRLLVLAFFVASLSFPALYLVIAYMSDPLNLMSRSRVIYENLNNDDRVRASLIARNASFNSVILGSSMLKVVSENVLSEGKNKYVNLSTSGSTIHERLSYLDFVLERKKLRSVVFSMDHGLSLHRRAFPVNTDPSNWMYLFDSILINDLQLYFQNFYFPCVISKSELPCKVKKTSSRKPESWYQTKTKKDQTISNLTGWKSKKGRWRLVKSRAKRIIKNTPFVKDDSTNYIDDLNHLRDIAKNNKKTEFILVIPPYSMLYLKLMYTHNNRMFSEYREFVSNIYAKLHQLPNVRLIYLDGNELTADLDNYIDMRHFNGKVLDSLLKTIKSDTNHIDQNFSHRFTEIENRLLNYDYSEFMKNYEGS